MARPKKSGDAFSLDDLAIAAGISGRAVRQVAEARLLPSGGDIRALKRVAVIGAFVASGVPLMAAARMAEAANLEFNPDDGEVPSGLKNLWRKTRDRLPREEMPALPESNAYWFHQGLRHLADAYTPGQAMDGDVVYEIAEREFVFIRYSQPVPDPFARDGQSRKLLPVGQINNWRRGGDPLFTHLSDMVRLLDDDLKPTEEVLELDDKMMAAHRNAVGIIRVNLSLAIRNGLDRLADYRAASERKAPR